MGTYNPDVNNYLDDFNNLDDPEESKKNRDTSPNADEKSKVGTFALPQINMKGQSPFKGFLDISVVSKKLRKTIASEGRQGNHSVRNSETTAVVAKDRFRSSSKKEAKMSPKVLETWINETL